jgi:hypothetical protein
MTPLRRSPPTTAGQARDIVDFNDPHAPRRIARIHRPQDRQSFAPPLGIRCPQHPSYPEAHGTIAGACVTALKAFLNESFVLSNPVVASDDGQAILPYTGADASQITVAGELNKLADNVAVGRDMADVHWRSDAEQSLLLGEAVTMSILRDQFQRTAAAEQLAELLSHGVVSINRLDQSPQGGPASVVKLPRRR